MRRVVIVNDKMQQGYRYELSALVGRDFEPHSTRGGRQCACWRTSVPAKNLRLM